MLELQYETRRVRRFLAKCMPDPESECIFWTGATNSADYGIVRWPGFTKCGVALAHRVAVWLFLGILLADDEEVEHLCSKSRLCVNVYHFEFVSKRINALRANARRWHGIQFEYGDPEPLPAASEEVHVW